MLPIITTTRGVQGDNWPLIHSYYTSYREGNVYAYILGMPLLYCGHLQPALIFPISLLSTFGTRTKCVDYAGTSAVANFQVS